MPAVNDIVTLSFAEGHFRNPANKTAHPKVYENNPNFLGMAQNLGLKFKAHKSFNKADIDERQALIQNICEVIWVGGGES